MFVVGAKVVEGVVCSVIDEGFQAGVEAPAASSTLAKHKRSVEGQDRMKTAAEQVLIGKSVADGSSKHAECVPNMDHPGAVAMEGDRRMEGASCKK